MSSLLKEIFERLEFERLIEEGKDPVELLHYKFQNVPSDIIDAVIEIDPTKKKSYSQWLLSKWDDEKKTIVDNLKNGRIQKLFQHYKKHQDIQIKDCPSVKDGLTKFVPEEDSVLEKSSEPTTLLMNRGWEKEVPSELANDFDIVFNQDDWVIAVPNTYEADCKLGENMNWCTAGGRSSYEGGRSYFDRYLSDYGGKYFVNFDMSKGESRLGKDYPFTRYQFHFESNQFMDKEDDPVELSEIDMPESAKEYYSDEGYDPDNFENLETRMERYDEQRWSVSFRINDDLYLGIAYDEDFQFEEPTPETDFYIFSNDDDRDPISRDEVANPHDNNDVVILNSDSLIILKKKYGKSDNGVIVAVTDNSRWGSWEAHSLAQYFVLPNNEGVFGVNDRDKYAYISSNGDECFDNTRASDCQKIFMNEYCTKWASQYYNDTLFVEAIAGNYHSLFAITPDSCEMIVRRDMPVNGEYFTINENKLVEGEFRNYKLPDEELYDGDTAGDTLYEFEDKLPTGDYLVATEGGYNILKSDTKQPLLDICFDKYIAYSKNLYGVQKEGKVGFFNIGTGQQAGKWYDTYGGLDKEKDIIYGTIGRYTSNMVTDVINGFTNKVTATFNQIISRRPINNKVVVLSTDGETSKVFDYVENKVYFPELNGFKRVDEYSHPFLFYCTMGSEEEHALFDLQSLNIVARGIKDVGRITRSSTNYIKLIKMDGKVNVFDTNKLTEMFPQDADDITGMNEYTNMIVYAVNGRYYPLDYKKNQVMINPNGIPVRTYVNDSERIFCDGNQYQISFTPDGNGNYKFYSWQNKSNFRDFGTNFDPQHTPQEVLELYSKIFGEQLPQQQIPAEQEAYAVAEEFKRIVKRIDEAIKRRYIDKID